MGVMSEIPGTALTPMQNDHLDWLEAESIYIIREVVAECRNPALLFSGGKDSIVMLHLALKAFRLGDREIELPFPLVHIDTGHNYSEVITFRDQRVAELGARLVVGHVEDSIKRGTVRLRKETDSRNAAESNAIRRRRECLNCLRRFTTFETVDLTIQVHKRDGRYEDFSLEKLTHGLDAACRHTKVSHEQIRTLASKIASDLMERQVREIETTELGEIVMKHLQDLDMVAYIRFA